MNIQNLNQDELKQLQILLNKMNPQPTEKIYLDPVNELIDDIMDEFNFAQVHNVMNYLNWKWVGEHVTIDMLREEAKRLLKRAADSRLNLYKDEHWELGVSHSTGGFRATAFCNEDKTEITHLQLQFVLTDWEAEIQD